MSRFSEGEEMFAGQYDLWRANADRAMNGRRGQQALRDLETALLQLPEKRLIHGHLALDGEVCAIGALVTYRREQRGEDRAEILRDLEALAPPLCECNHAEIEHVDGLCAGCIERSRWWNDARTANLDAESWMLRARPPSICTAFVRDEDEPSDDYGDVTVDAGKKVGLTYVFAWEIAWANDEQYSTLTPERRYERTLEWVRSKIITPAAA